MLCSLTSSFLFLLTSEVKKIIWYILWTEQLLDTGSQRVSWLYMVPTYCFSQQERTDFHHYRVFTLSAVFLSLGEMWLCAFRWFDNHLLFLCVCVGWGWGGYSVMANCCIAAKLCTSTTPIPNIHSTHDFQFKNVGIPLCLMVQLLWYAYSEVNASKTFQICLDRRNERLGKLIMKCSETSDWRFPPENLVKPLQTSSGRDEKKSMLNAFDLPSLRRRCILNQHDSMEDVSTWVGNTLANHCQ